MAKLPKYVRISIAADDQGWGWCVRSDYPTGAPFEIGAIFHSEQKATRFALEQAEFYRDKMDDHTFMVVLNDGKKDIIID